MSLPVFDKCTKAERKKSVVERFLCDLPMAVPLSDPSLDPPCVPRCASHVCVGTRGYTCMRSYYTAPTTRCTALTLLLLAAPAYGYSSIIARHTETHLEAFARRERATISFYLSSLCPSSTSDVTENRGLAVVINDSLRNHTIQCRQRTSLEFVQNTDTNFQAIFLRFFLYFYNENKSTKHYIIIF